MSEPSSGSRGRPRRRRSNVPGGAFKRYPVSVSEFEAAQLVVRAERLNVTVPRLLLESALADESGVTVTERREAFGHLFAVRRLLGAVSNNVNQIARAVNSGAPVSAELQQTLRAVREVAARVDQVIAEGRDQL